jgi:uncharacterized membrane protein YkoI
MKALLYTIVFSVIGAANTQLMVDNTIQLRTYNHKLSLKLKKQRELRQLTKIKYEEALEIASSYCKEDIISQRLTHKGQLLFYRSYTENCKVEINALDGALISKVLSK